MNTIWLMTLAQLSSKFVNGHDDNNPTTCCAGLANLMSSVLLSLGVALGVPVAEAEEADRETLGAPARLEGPLDVLLLVAAAGEPVGAAAGTVAAMMAHRFMCQVRRV